MTAKINILNLIDFEEVNKLLEGFNQSTGFVTAILDLKGNVLSKSGWRQICTHFHRINTETSKNCTVSDTVLANELGNGEKYHFYKCLNGLVDVAVPIIIKGEHIANLFSGQFFFEEPDRGYFKKQAEKYGFNQQEYFNALENVPVVSKEKVKVAMDFLLNMTQLISEMTYQKLEQVQLNEALIKSEERFKGAFDHLLEGCQIIGHDWRYIYLNPSAGIHNRRSNEELLGNRYQDMWPGIEKTEIFKIIERVLVTRIPYQLENEFVFPDGNIGWFDLSIQPVPEGVFILSIDITERKNAEIALRESEKKYRIISDNTDDWIYWIAPDGNLLYVSPACERVTGYSPDEFTNNPELIHEIVFDTDKEKLNQHHQFSQLDNTQHELEYRIITKSGELRWISHSCAPIFNNEGEYMGRRGTNRNITEHKRDEEEIRQLNERISTATRASQVGIWDWDIQRNVINWDDQMYALYGLKNNEFTGAYEAWLNGLHPDDREFSKNETQLALTGEKEYDTEFRVVWPDGSIHFIKAKAEVSRNDTREPFRMVGINIDITKQKLAEEALRYNEALLREVGRIASVGGWEFDPATGHSTWTEEVARIHDLDPKTSASVSLSLNYYSENSKPIIEKAFRETIEQAKPYDLELEIITAKGNHKWVRTIGRPIVENGKVIRVQGSLQDITELKLAEVTLRESEGKFRKLIESIPLPVAYTNSLGEITFRNDRFLQVLGYTYDEVPTVNEWYLKAYPDETYRQQVIKKWDLAVKNAQTTNTDIDPIEYNITCKNGTVRTMIVSGIIIA